MYSVKNVFTEASGVGSATHATQQTNTSSKATIKKGVKYV